MGNNFSSIPFEESVARHSSLVPHGQGATTAVKSSILEYYFTLPLHCNWCPHAFYAPPLSFSLSLSLLHPLCTPPTPLFATRLHCVLYIRASECTFQWWVLRHDRFWHICNYASNCFLLKVPCIPISTPIAFACALFSSILYCWHDMINFIKGIDQFWSCKCIVKEKFDHLAYK